MLRINPSVISTKNYQTGVRKCHCLLNEALRIFCNEITAPRPCAPTAQKMHSRLIETLPLNLCTPSRKGTRWAEPGETLGTCARRILRPYMYRRQESGTASSIGRTA